jgi:hypothetical protein
MKLRTLALAAALVTPAFAQPPTAEAFFKQGQSAEQAGDPIAAKQAYLSALKLDPNFAKARFSLGQLKIHGKEISARGREAKFGAVVIPVFQLDGATLQESLAALGSQVEKASADKVAPNFVIQDPKGALADTKISLNVKAMPARGILKYITDQAAAKVRYDEHAIVVSPVAK